MRTPRGKLNLGAGKMHGTPWRVTALDFGDSDFNLIRYNINEVDIRAEALHSELPSEQLPYSKVIYTYLCKFGEIRSSIADISRVLFSVQPGLKSLTGRQTLPSNDSGRYFGR